MHVPHKYKCHTIYCKCYAIISATQVLVPRWPRLIRKVLRCFVIPPCRLPAQVRDELQSKVQFHYKLCKVKTCKSITNCAQIITGLKFSRPMLVKHKMSFIPYPISRKKILKIQMSWLLEYFFGNLDSYVLSAKAEVLVLRSFFSSQFLSICPARAQNVQLIFCSKLSCLHLIKRNFLLDMLKYIGSKISKIFLK